MCARHNTTHSDSNSVGGKSVMLTTDRPELQENGAEQCMSHISFPEHSPRRQGFMSHVKANVKPSQVDLFHSVNHV